MSAPLSYAQLKGTWLAAAKGTKYDTNQWASLMAAIAEAESSGIPTSTNPTDNGGKQTSWGLWQISNGTHSEPAANWADPAENARLAIAKLNTQGLTAWGTYDSGAYKAFLSDKTAADLKGVPPGPDAVTTAAITAAAKTQAMCAWSVGWGGISPGSFLVGLIDPLASSAASSSGEACIISKTQVRAALGIGLLVAGGLIVLLGLTGAAVKTIVAPVLGSVGGPAVAGLAAGAAARAPRAPVPAAPAPSQPEPAPPSTSAQQVQSSPRVIQGQVISSRELES